jgi:hypothetical protein
MPGHVASVVEREVRSVAPGGSVWKKSISEQRLVPNRGAPTRGVARAIRDADATGEKKIRRDAFFPLHRRPTISKCALTRIAPPCDAWTRANSAIEGSGSANAGAFFDGGGSCSSTS